MKRIILPSLLSIALSITATFNITAQTGPGGVGNSSNNILWLDASSLNLNDGDPVSTWTDISGNGNDAIQNIVANQPIYSTLYLGGTPVINFLDGGNDFFNITNHIEDTSLTTFLVHSPYRKWTLPILEFKNHTYSSLNDNLRTEFQSTINEIPTFIRRFSVIGFSTSSSVDTGTVSMWRASNLSTTSRGAMIQNNNSYIGYNSDEWADAYKYFRGQIAEIIVFSDELNSAKRRIVNEYLGVKYGLTTESSLYSYRSTHSNKLIGIGQESDGNHLIASDQDKITIESKASMNNGEYFLVANDNLGFSASTNVPPGYSARWRQTWRVSETGEVGDLKITMEIDGDGLLTNGTHVLLVDDDGDFDNGGTRYYDITTTTAIPFVSFEFDNINLNDGEYFTLAKKTDGVSTVSSGSWHNASTWSCGCIPNSEDVATINNGHTVSITSNASIYDLTIDGTLTFNNSDTLFIYKELIVNNVINSGTGTIAAVNPVEGQTFTNNSGVTIELNNLFINNNSGLLISNGDWALNNSLQVSNGGLDVSSANSFTLISNGTTTAEILPSMDNAFSGNYTLQRHISKRWPRFANLSSPITNATVADIDDDNIIISGVGGNDGDILYSDNSTFYSLYFYDAVNQAHQTITSTSTALPPTKGFELYLLSNSSSFEGGTIDYVGEPNNGSISSRLEWKWNFIGNPYYAHIYYDSLERKYPSIQPEYMIFNSRTGTYDLYTGSGKPAIAPGQGFWLWCSAAWGPNLTFEEDAKVSSNSSSFKRRKYIDPYFSLNISNQENPFSHKMRLAFDAFSTEELDEKDSRHLPSPIKEAPAIYSKAVNSEEELIVNSLNPTEESQLVPVSIYAGVEGKYEISADNIDALYENYSCVYLKDNDSEKAVDLMVEPNYAFEAKQGKSDRFHLILSNSYEECQEMIENGSFTQKLDTKVSLRNAYDNWYLDYTLGEAQTQLEIRVYNMSGQEVKAPMSFEANGAGTYPLQHLNDLEGIYLIQIVGEDIFLNKQVKL